MIGLDWIMLEGTEQIIEKKDAVYSYKYLSLSTELLMTSQCVNLMPLTQTDAYALCVYVHVYICVKPLHQVTYLVSGLTIYFI